MRRYPRPSHRDREARLYHVTAGESVDRRRPRALAPRRRRVGGNTVGPVPGAEISRSFDFAVASVLYDRAAIRPASRSALQPRSEDWRRRAEQVYLAGYRAPIGYCSSFPRNEASFSHLIEKFVLERSLYKIYYEEVNRLDSIHIPLAGVAKIICHGK